MKFTLGPMFYRKGLGGASGKAGNGFSPWATTGSALQHDSCLLSPRTSENEVATCSDGAVEICFSSSRELTDTHLLPDSACDTQVGLVW